MSGSGSCLDAALTRPIDAETLAPVSVPSVFETVLAASSYVAHALYCAKAAVSCGCAVANTVAMLLVLHQVYCGDFRAVSEMLSVASCCSAASSSLRWAMSRTAVPGAAKVHRNGETKNKERSIDIKKIVKVETGTGQFPGSHGTKGILAQTAFVCSSFLCCSSHSLHLALICPDAAFSAP